MASYHTYVQNHAGYSITIGLAVVALFFTMNDFIARFGSWAFWGVIGLGASLMAYNLIRIAYWSLWVNQTVLMNKRKAAELFNEENNIRKAYRANYEAPNTALLHLAIYRSLCAPNKKNYKHWYSRWSLRIKMFTSRRRPKFR